MRHAAQDPGECCRGLGKVPNQKLSCQSGGKLAGRGKDAQLFEADLTLLGYEAGSFTPKTINHTLLEACTSLLPAGFAEWMKGGAPSWFRASV